MSHDVDGELIRKLATLLDETGLGEIEYATADWRIRVARPSAPAVTALAAAPVVAGQGAAGPSLPERPADAPGTVRSPMVGTAFLAPSPGADPFVKVGDRVSKGQTLLIIEAMKVMNPIAAPQDGIVARVIVGNGDPVEYGQPLLVIE